MGAADTETLFLEINLISAQGLRPPHGTRRLQAYAVIWVDPAFKLRTLVDRVSGENPNWNDKFLFLVPPRFLTDDSPSAVSVEIFVAGGWYLSDSLVGAVRLLVGNLRLLSRRRDRTAFHAVGIRRPSGCFEGVLNVGAAVLGSVPQLAVRALALRPAIGYRELMAPKNRRGTPALGEAPLGVRKKPSPTASAEKEAADDGAVAFCGPCVLGFWRRVDLELGPPDRSLEQLSWTPNRPKSAAKP